MYSLGTNLLSTCCVAGPGEVLRIQQGTQRGDSIVKSSADGVAHREGCRRIRTVAGTASLPSIPLPASAFTSSSHLHLTSRNCEFLWMRQRDWKGMDALDSRRKTDEGRRGRGQSRGRLGVRRWGVVVMPLTGEAVQPGALTLK